MTKTISDRAAQQLREADVAVGRSSFLAPDDADQALPRDAPTPDNTPTTLHRHHHASVRRVVDGVLVVAVVGLVVGVFLVTFNEERGGEAGLLNELVAVHVAQLK